MSGFADNFEQNDVDPAAEFLAREQDELAGLEDEVKPAAIATPILNGGDEPVTSASSFEIVEGFDDGLSVDRKNDDFLFTPEPTYERNEDFDNTYDELRQVSPSPPPVREVREEPEKIKKWREEQIKRLEEKDAEEERKKLELREKARKELEDWYKNHEEAIAKTKAANRNAEKQFVADDNVIEPGTEWERIAKLCDFNPKAKQGNKDVSRMRSIILQLKQSPIQINNKA